MDQKKFYEMVNIFILYGIVNFLNKYLMVNPLECAGKRQPAGIEVPTYTCRQSQTVSQLIVWYC